MFNEKVPKTGYDLIDLIDTTIERPVFPSTAMGMGQLGTEDARLRVAFSQGARAMADTLRDWKAQEIEDKLRGDNPDVSDADVAMAQAPSKYPDIYNPEGELHKPLSPGGVAVVVD